MGSSGHVTQKRATCLGETSKNSLDIGLQQIQAKLAQKKSEFLSCDLRTPTKNKTICIEREDDEELLLEEDDSNSQKSHKSENSKSARSGGSNESQL